MFSRICCIKLNKRKYDMKPQTIKTHIKCKYFQKLQTLKSGSLFLTLHPFALYFSVNFAANVK